MKLAPISTIGWTVFVILLLVALRIPYLWIIAIAAGIYLMGWILELCIDRANK